MIALLAPACARRDVSSGEWKGVGRPDATMSTSGPGRDEAGDLSKGIDAAPAVTADAGAAGLAPTSGDGSTPPRGALDPMTPRDAADDVGDARSCPESGPCE